MYIRKDNYCTDDVLGFPETEYYYVSFLTVKNKAVVDQIYKQKISKVDLIAKLNESNKWPIFACTSYSQHEHCRYSFIDSSGIIAIREKGTRATGRYFLRQYFEEVTVRSKTATGLFEVNAIETTNEDECDKIKGYVSTYYSRANQILKDTAGITLHQWGVWLHRRADAYSDQNGTSCPTYAYRLEGSVFYIKPIFEPD